jgi:hypothetical protein
MRSGGPLITYSPAPRRGDLTTVLEVPRGPMPVRCDPGMLLPLDAGGTTVLLLKLSDCPIV